VEFVQAVVLGVVQGVAEFLPISSSGHLVIIPAVFGWTEFAGNVAFDVLLHLGTLVAVFAYFWRDLWRMLLAAFSSDPAKAGDRRLAWLVVIATFVTGAIGLAFNDFFESLFAQVAWVGLFLMVTALILVLAEKLSTKRGHAPERMTWLQACGIGLAQGVAIMPGISRSGATISAGLAAGLDREQSARFSFLLSAPIILLASAKTAVDAFGSGTSTLPSLAVSLAGFAASAIAGYLTIAWLLNYLKTRSLYPFAVYTALVGAAVLVWQLVLV
jgi:undecaprenyl-diphosphatase